MGVEYGGFVLSQFGELIDDFVGPDGGRFRPSAHTQRRTFSNEVSERSSSATISGAALEPTEASLAGLFACRDSRSWSMR